MGLFGLFGKRSKPEPKASQPAVKAEPKSSPPVKQVEIEAEVETEQSFRLSEADITVSSDISNKADLMSLVSDKMQLRGYVSSDYTKALNAREAKVSTYLINGVAIPHGTEEAKNQVVKTGLVVIQLPDGVVWNDKGDTVHLVVGIAAKGTAHLELLQQLTTVVMNAELAEQLGKQADASTIVSVLNGDTAEPTQKVEVSDLSTQVTATVADEAGMHARPASLLAEMAADFQDTTIRIRNGQNQANAKSMAELLTMGAVHGDSLVVSADGPQAESAIQKLADAINAGLDSDEDDAGNQNYEPLKSLGELIDPKGSHVASGSSASRGIAMAPVFVLLGEELMSIEKDASDARAEQFRLNTVLATAKEQLADVQSSLQSSAPQEAAIFKAQQQLLSDESVLNDAQQLIIQGRSAAWAWRTAIQRQIEALSAVEDERLKARIADMTDVSERVVNLLMNRSSDIQYPDQDFILLAKELTPSQTVKLKDVPIKGICTELGGPNSHMAILARALGLPAIVGIGDPLSTSVSNDTMVLLDAQSSQFIVDPDQATQTQAEQLIQQWGTIVAEQNAQKHLPPVTLDGHKMEVVCNIANPADAASVLEQGGEGVGLLRTEFLFEASTVEPTMEQQQEILQEIAGHIGDKTLVVRTADIGGDKPVSWLDMPKEDNPFLGVRGIRLSFKHEPMFRRQLEAIYRTALWQQAQGVKSGLHIMFPMIANMDEWRRARDMAEEIRAQLDAPVLPLGIMVEVPSVVICADHFAKEVDFFSIGSNDLTQYTLAMDRMHPELPSDLDNYQPALLRLIKMTVDAASAKGKWVGVCGNMAADPNLACLLTGLGVTELSISPANVAAVKHLIRSMNYSELKSKAEQALTISDPAQIKALFDQPKD